jgi:hypothetical protein
LIKAIGKYDALAAIGYNAGYAVGKWFKKLVFRAACPSVTSLRTFSKIKPWQIVAFRAGEWFAQSTTLSASFSWFYYYLRSYFVFSLSAL